MAKKQKKKDNLWKWVVGTIVIVFLVYFLWIVVALLDVSGNPLGVNSGKIKTYSNIIEVISNNTAQYVGLYKVGGSEDYDFVMRLIEDDFATLDECESNLEKYGVGDREDIVEKLEIARLKLDLAKAQIMKLANL